MIRVDLLENLFDLIAHVLLGHKREVVGVGVERLDHLVQLALVDAAVAVRVVHVEDELEALRNVTVHDRGQASHELRDIDALGLGILIRTSGNERAKPLTVGREAEFSNDAVERLLVDIWLAIPQLLGKQTVHAMQLFERDGKQCQHAVEQLRLA